MVGMLALRISRGEITLRLVRCMRWGVAEVWGEVRGLGCHGEGIGLILLVSRLRWRISLRAELGLRIRIRLVGRAVLIRGELVALATVARWRRVASDDGVAFLFARADGDEQESEKTESAHRSPWPWEP